MTKRLWYFLSIVSCILLLQCKSKDANKIDDKEIDSGIANGKRDKSTDIQRVAADYCDCFNTAAGEVPSTIKQLVITSSYTDNPAATLKAEMMKIKDIKERNQLAQNFQKVASNLNMQTCTDKIKKTYHLDESDTLVQQKILHRLEEKEACSLIAAFLRIGFKTSPQ